MPLHYTNENGEYGIPERFRSSLRETSSITSAERTEKNIKDSDGILTLLMEPSAIRKSANETLKTSPGTLHGIEYAKRLGKHDDQLLFVNLAQEDDQLVSERDKIVHWLIEHEIKKCAIGGPRESEAIGIENEAFIFLKKVFEKYKKEIQKISE